MTKIESTIEDTIEQLPDTIMNFAGIVTYEEVLDMARQYQSNNQKE